MTLEAVPRPVTSLTHQEGREFSERGSNFLNYVQHIFPGGGGEIFSKGDFAPCSPPVTGLAVTQIKNA